MQKITKKKRFKKGLHFSLIMIGLIEISKEIFKNYQDLAYHKSDYKRNINDF